MNLVNVSFRPLMALLLSVALNVSGVAAAHGAPAFRAASAQTSFGTTYGYFYMRQLCQAEDGQYYHYSFITNIFGSPSNKSHGQVTNEAQAAFFAMVKTEGWTCLNEGIPELYQGAPLATVQQAREATIRYESSARVNLYSYNYADGAAQGTFPTLLHQDD